MYVYKYNFMTMQIIDQPGHLHSHPQLGLLEAMKTNIYNNQQCNSTATYKVCFSDNE